MLRHMVVEPIPHGAAHVALAAFPNRHRYLRLIDELDAWFTDEAFLTLFPTHAQPTWSPCQLGLVTILQFMEGLSGHQAAKSVRTRIDWKCVLHMEFADPGIEVVGEELRHAPPCR